jgi:hypothetical protein
MRRRHRGSAEAGYSGIAAELGVYDDVFLCLSPGEPWLEHGIVEHRYKELCPTAYRRMIDRWGHVIQGPRRYSVTAFLTRTWARLAADGLLAAQLGPRHWRVSAQAQHHHPVLGASPGPRAAADPDMGRLRS